MNANDFILPTKASVRLEDVFLDGCNRESIVQLLREQKYADKLQSCGLPIDNKVLFFGSSGCGKTMTANAIAQQLGRPLLVMNLSQIVSPRIGETSQHLKLIFDKAAKERAVLFLDEFDQIAKARQNDDKDVGEMRRLVNTIIQLIDYFSERSLLICATNHVEIIDEALLRRFQLRISFRLPTRMQLDAYYEELLTRFVAEGITVVRKYDISYAEAKDYAYTQIKGKLIERWENSKETFNV